jgi:hypothetical protein
MTRLRAQFGDWVPPILAWAAVMSMLFAATWVLLSAHKSPERRDLLPNRRPHPYADQHRVGRVVAEQFEMSHAHGCVEVSQLVP